MNKINIYCHKLQTDTIKKNKYVNKIAKTVYNLQKGGFIKYTLQQESETKKINADELLKYVKERVNKLNGNTKNKYFVILMGSPGSGKTISRKLAVKYISKYLENNTDDDLCNDIFNSFIDIAIDDIVYDGQIEETKKEYISVIKTGREKFKELSTKYKSYNDYDEDKLAKESEDLYFGMRPAFDSVGEILLNISAYLNANIFFETLGNEQYIKTLINTVCIPYKYNLLIIYSSITNEDIHIERLKKRGISEGRFPNIEYVKNKRTMCKLLYNKLPEIVIPFVGPSIKNCSLINFENDKIMPSDYNFNEFIIHSKVFNYDDSRLIL
jgi:hypothetical protein